MRAEHALACAAEPLRKSSHSAVNLTSTLCAAFSTSTHPTREKKMRVFRKCHFFREQRPAAIPNSACALPTKVSWSSAEPMMLDLCDYHHPSPLTVTSITNLCLRPPESHATRNFPRLVQTFALRLSRASDSVQIQRHSPLRSR